MKDFGPWLAWVKTHDAAGRWSEWVSWIEERYGYGEAVP